MIDEILKMIGEIIEMTDTEVIDTEMIEIEGLNQEILTVINEIFEVLLGNLVGNLVENLVGNLVDTQTDLDLKDLEARREEALEVL